MRFTNFHHKLNLLVDPKQTVPTTLSTSITLSTLTNSGHFVHRLVRAARGISCCHGKGTSPPSLQNPAVCVWNARHRPDSRRAQLRWSALALECLELWSTRLNILSDGLLALSKSALSNLHWAILMIPLQREFSETFRYLSDIFNIVRYNFKSSSVSSKLHRLELAQKLHAAIAPVFSRQHVVCSSQKVSDCRSSPTKSLVADFIANYRLHCSSPYVVNQFFHSLKHVSVVCDLSVVLKIRRSVVHGDKVVLGYKF